MVEDILPYGALVEIYADGDKCLTGYLENIEDTQTGDNYTVTISGRSKTCDVVDSSCTGTVYENVTLGQFARAVAGSVDVVLAASEDTSSKPFARRAAASDETRFDAIEKASGARGLIVTDDANGALVITRVRASTPVASLGHSFGAPAGVTPVLKSSRKVNTSALFARYEVRGQVAPIDGNKSFAGYAASVTEPLMAARNRVLTLKAESGADRERCAYRATWEAQSRLAKAVQIECQVMGWRTPERVLYQPGQTVRFIDSRRRVDAPFIVSAVTLDATGTGRTASLVLVHPDCYDVIEPLKRKKSPLTQGARWKEIAQGVTL
jgi:prophage tail gpP-like protein